MTAKSHNLRASSQTDKPAGNQPNVNVGASIALGAGMGLVAGILSRNPLLGLLVGAGLGTVVGAVRSSHRAPRTP